MAVWRESTVVARCAKKNREFGDHSLKSPLLSI